MDIYYIVKSFGDICISYTLLFCISYTLFYGDIIADGLSEIWLNNRAILPLSSHSPYTMPYLVFSIDLFKRDCKARDDAR